MKVMTVSEVLADLGGALDAVVDDSEELLILRGNRPSAVLMELSDFQALREGVGLPPLTFDR